VEKKFLDEVYSKSGIYYNTAVLLEEGREWDEA
jgi:hypothetical protein